MTQNTVEPEDLRVRRTRKLLQEALLALTVEQGFAAVSVRDITERAMVNRSTFYRHYLDKYDLLDQYLQEVYEILSDEAFMRERTSHKPGDPPIGLVKLVKHVQEHASFYRVMLDEKGDAYFIQRFRENIERRFRIILQWNGSKPEADAPPIEMQLNFVSCADIGVILWWLKNDQPCTPEQLAMWMSQLAIKAVGLNLRSSPDTSGTPADQ